MKLCALLLLAGSLVFACTITSTFSDTFTYASAAQEAAERGPDSGTQTRVPGVMVLPATGRPFSARGTTEWTRNVEDGSVVKTHLFAMVARDSQGRIYRERRHFVPDDSNQEPQKHEMTILDPTTHTATVCTVAMRHCTVSEYHAPTTFTPQPVGAFDHGTRFLTRETLGTSVIDGIDVIGTRETVTLSAGAVGNSQPMVTTREFWYSPELQINLAVTRKDPREGTQDIQLVELSRAEPDPPTFQIPADYVVDNP
jgi:hypothetical protein